MKCLRDTIASICQMIDKMPNLAKAFCDESSSFNIVFNKQYFQIDLPRSLGAKLIAAAACPKIETTSTGHRSCLQVTGFSLPVEYLTIQL